MVTQLYILIAIGALAAIFAIRVYKRKIFNSPLSRLAGAAFLLILAGIFFSDNRIAAYTLIALGVGLAIADILRKRKR